MATLAEDEATRASTNGTLRAIAMPIHMLTSNIAAEQFVDAYYNTLSSARHQISSYYMPMNVLPTGRTLPLITYNGQQISDPQVFQTTYQEQMPFTYFEVQSLNAHVMNPSLTPIEPANNKGKGKVKELENNMSLLVQVSGYVRLVERREGPMRGFSDTFTLVPNKETVGAKGTGKTGEGRAWVIQSQNFRFVV